MDFFTQLDAETQGLLINLAGNLIQVIAIFAGIWIAAYQIRKGYEHGIRLQKENIKNEYFTKLHAEIEEVIKNLIDKNCAFASSLRNISLSFHAFRTSLDAGIQNPIVRVDSIQQLHDKRYNLGKAIISLISTVEKYEIVEPRIKIFQTAFNVASYDLDRQCDQLFYQLLHVLPNQPEPNSLSVPFRVPNQQLEEVINTLIDAYLNTKHDVGSYTYDLRVEIQNLLLSGLFERKLERRKPLDPALKVISTDSPEYEELMNYFGEETAWGRNKQEVEVRVIENLQSSNTSAV